MSDSSGNKQRLLIVDDSKVIRVTARKILQDHFETVEAVNGKSAWEILTGEPAFSLVVSDLTMPGMDGFGLLKKIRSSPLPHISNLPVIIITGANDSEETMRRATDAGATDFIGKPFDAVHLLTRTQAHAEAYATEQSLTQETMALEEQALIDQFSGLPNESAFMERGHQQLAYAIRHDSGLALACIEIDDFGKHYARFGEDITGAMIKRVASVLSFCIRQEDMAARIGTSRFALLLPGMNKDGCRHMAERILLDINSRPLEHAGTQVRFTLSIGIEAPSISGDLRFNTVMSTATARMQTAMNRGGNAIVHTSAPEKRVTDEQHVLKPDSPSAGPVDLAGAAAAGATVESAAPQIEEYAPDAITDPLPDLEVVGTSEETAPAVTGTEQHFPAAAFVEEESIVITAPGEYYDEDEEA
ncbi:MAG: response regulator, partial [Thiohalobacterales bacterium]|nr:response regulator [Thiohalobacterales bacterium]